MSENESQHSIYEEDEPRRPVWARRPSSNINFDDFRVDISEFEGKLNPEEFLDWLSTVEKVFEYKDVPENKNTKLVALKLRKYASLLWTTLCAKGTGNQKEKIRMSENMKTKLKAWFSPSSYIQDSYAQLHTLSQGSMSVDEYTREFKNS